MKVTLGSCTQNPTLGCLLCSSIMAQRVLYMSHHLSKSWPKSIISHILRKYFSSILVQHMTPMGGNSYQCLSLSDNYLDYVIRSKLIWIFFLRAYDGEYITGQGWKTMPDCKSLYRVHISFIPAGVEIVTSLRNFSLLLVKWTNLGMLLMTQSFRSVNWES